MKWISEAISGQNLYLKLALFVTGIGTGLSSSIRIIGAKIALFLIYLILEPSLYCHLFKAIKKLIPFLAGYWLFSTLLNQDFPSSVRFTLQLIYFLLLMVSVFGGVSVEQALSDSSYIRKWAWINSGFVFCIATLMYTQSFFAQFAKLRARKDKQAIIEQIEAVVQTVSDETESIRSRIGNLLQSAVVRNKLFSEANVVGIVFLTLLVIVNGL